MIRIYGINGSTLYDVLESSSCKKVEELMATDQVELSWYSRTGTTIPAGAYIVMPLGSGTERYTLLEPYQPTQKGEARWEYTPVFKSRMMAWQKVPFFMYTEVSGVYHREIDWSLTAGPLVFLERIQLGILVETGEEYELSYDSALAGSKTLSFSSTDIFSALNSIADAFETEWWIDKEEMTIHLSKCNRGGTAVDLEVGENVSVPTISENGEGYYNRFYVFGSTRNIVQDYNGANVNNLVNKRLTLDPTDYPGGYYEPNPIPTGGKVFSKILTFDDIYPSATTMKVADPVFAMAYVKDETTNERIQIGTDTQGKPIYDKYAKWFFTIYWTPDDEEEDEQFFLNDWNYSDSPQKQGGAQPGLEGMLIAGLNLSLKFTSGSLQGREFELAYHKNAGQIQSVIGEDSSGAPIYQNVPIVAGTFELKYIKEGNYIIPDASTLIPDEGDKVVLFNIKMPDEYISDAYERLEEEMIKTINEKYLSDQNQYSCESYPIAFNEDNPELKIGTKVNYINGAYSFETRVTKLSTSLEHTVKQSIAVGNSLVKGTIQELKEEVTEANRNIDLIAALNSATRSIADAYSRTQQIVINNFAKISEMFELDTVTIPGKTIIKAKHDGLYSNGFISANGASQASGGGGGASTLYELNDVKNNGSAVTRLDGTPVQNGDVFVYSSTLSKWYAIPQDSITPDLTDYATKVWVNAQGFLKEHQSLTDYAKTAWVTSQLLNYMAKADLLDNGLIKASLLPSYVDDVIEAASKSAFPNPGESGKIYVAKDTNKTYRWGGSDYVEISESLALGETSGTAYEGSKGKANADAIAGILQTLASGVVSSVGGQSGAITLKGDNTANGTINLSITGKQVAATIIGLQALAYKASLAFSELTGKPTTLSGYGITDAYTKTEAGNTFLGKTAKASDADKLDGHDSTYFQTALSQTQLNALQFFSVVTVDGHSCLKLNPDYAGLFAEGFLSANGASMGSGGGGGATTLKELNDVLNNGSAVTRADGTAVQDGDVFVYDLTKSKWCAYPQSEISPDLTPYAEKTWVEEKNYATKPFVNHKTRRDLDPVPVVVKKAIPAEKWRPGVWYKGGGWGPENWCFDFKWTLGEESGDYPIPSSVECCCEELAKLIYENQRYVRICKSNAGGSGWKTLDHVFSGYSGTTLFVGSYLSQTSAHSFCVKVASRAGAYINFDGQGIYCTSNAPTQRTTSPYLLIENDNVKSIKPINRSGGVMYKLVRNRILDSEGYWRSVRKWKKLRDASPRRGDTIKVYSLHRGKRSTFCDVFTYSGVAVQE